MLDIPAQEHGTLLVGREDAMGKSHGIVHAWLIYIYIYMLWNFFGTGTALFDREHWNLDGYVICELCKNEYANKGVYILYMYIYICYSQSV